MPEDDPFHPYVDNTYSHDNTRETIGPQSMNVVMYDDLFDPYDHCNVLELNGMVNMLGTHWPPMDRYLYGEDSSGDPYNWYTLDTGG